MAKSTFQKRRNQAAINVVGENIRKLRQIKGMTISEFAFKCKLEPNQIGRMERGISDSNITMLTLVAGALDIDIKDLFTQE